MDPIKVLIVDDDKQWQRTFVRAFTDKGIQVLGALTIKQAEEMFVENPDIKAVVMDACVPGDDPTTLPLTRKFRETFSGPMIAISSRDDFRRQLMAAGCDRECLKQDLPQKLCEILNL